MPRITYVKKTQQTYYTVPVLNEDGTPKMTPVMGKDGQQKTTKKGTLVFRAATVNDYDRPKPNPVCDKCGTEITVGMPCKHITPKSGPYGGQRRTRCDSCPGWHVWEYSSSMSARLAEIEHSAMEAIYAADDPDGVAEALTMAADAVRDVAQEKADAGQAMEDGMGHESEKSTELNGISEQLIEWADEIEGADIPDLPEPEEAECDIDEECEGTACTRVSDDSSGCECACHKASDEATEEQMDEWRTEVQDAVSVLGDCPV